MQKSVKASAVFPDLLPCNAPCPGGRLAAVRPGTAFGGIPGSIPLFETCLMVVFMVLAWA